MSVTDFILIVDDNPGDRALVQRAVREVFPESVALTPRNEVEFQNALYGPQPLVAVTDYHICWIDGLQVLRRIKETWPDCPVVMFTGTGDEATAVEGMKCGLDDYVLKTEQHRARLPAALHAAVANAQQRAELRTTQESLRASEQRLAGILDSTMDGIVTIDEQGQILLVNAAAERIFRTTIGEVLGARIERFVVFSARATLRERLEALAATAGRIGEIVAVRGAGEEFPVEYTISPAVVGGQRIFTLVLRDVSERKQLERQLRQAQKMEAFGQLASGVAHDFNNVLVVIAGNAELMLSRSHLPPREHQQVALILGAASRAAALTRQLLIFSRDEEPRRVRGDLSEIVTNYVKLLHRVIGENIELQTAPAAEALPVLADPNMLEQVIMNLAINARDAMPEGGRLVFATGRVALDAAAAGRYGCAPGDYGELRVRDSGVGMRPEVQARIFEPFFTTKERGKGTGLGLSTVLAIVQQHGGGIAVQSEPRRGTEFSVCLPLATGPEEARVPALAEPVAGAEKPRSGTVLVVEDDEAVRGTVTMALEAVGYRVVAAHTAAAALAVLAQSGSVIDLLLTDVVMPGGLSGVQLARRATAEHPRLPIVLMSGYSREIEQAGGRLLPHMQLLPKPFTIEQLLGAVEAGLRRGGPAGAGR
jgi:two-component system, cell cycle sensor histidine kinase and response regulator CckA